MKKTLIIIGIIITFFILYFLQANFFTWFNIAGIKPNLFIILVLFISLFAGAKIGIPFGIVLGFVIDILIGKDIGTSSIMLGIIGILGAYFDKNFSKDSRITIMLMVIGSTCLYEIGDYIITAVKMGINIEILNFIKILAIETTFNTIIIVILYPLMQKLGYYIEDIYKGQKILTRYF